MKIISRITFCLMLGAVLSGTSAASAAEPGLAFENAWVRAMPPGMSMTAGFGTLRNDGPGSIELIAFASPRFRQVSLHRSEVAEGVSRMREVPSLVIPEGESVELAPGGYHLMLMNAVVPVEPGNTIEIVMRGADGSKWRFEMRVERR